MVRGLYDLHGERLPPDATTVERGLRRLRKRGALSGETYGRLLLKTYGLPPSIGRWARALGTYHGPLIDLPLALRREQLRLWDRPPVIESAQAAWIHLALASLAHHDRDLAACDRRLELARLGLRRAGPDALAEHTLFAARRLADTGDTEGAAARLSELSLDGVEEPDASCLRARWLDQRAYLVSRNWRTDPMCLEEAEALRRAIPRDGPPFVVFRRHHGLAWVRWRRGDDEGAREHAMRAVEVAGDGGLLRLRASALRLWAAIDPSRSAALKPRWESILARLED